MTLSKRQIAHQFSRAASTYDDVSPLQREMAERLMESVSPETSGTLVDLGCGTGWALEQFASRKKFKLIGVDFAPAMIETAKDRVESAQFHCCDLETTPLEDSSADLVFSNAAIQWCDTATAIGEMYRICKPNGLLRLSTFCPGTLREIQSAWQESGDPINRVHEFESATQLETILSESGFRNISFHVDESVQKFSSVEALLASIKQLGATNALRSRTEGILS
jgi:malonyl-CoA O-methyltransferase